MVIFESVAAFQLSVNVMAVLKVLQMLVWPVTCLIVVCCSCIADTGPMKAFAP